MCVYIYFLKFIIPQQEPKSLTLIKIESADLETKINRS